MRSKLSPVNIPDNVSIWDFMRKRLKHHSERNRVALIDGPTGLRYSYRELLASIRNVGIALLQRGFQKGDILCIISANCCQYPMALHGVLSIGGIVTTCNPQCTGDDIKNQLQDSGARWIVTSLDNIAKVRDAAQSLTDIKEMFIIDDDTDCSSFSALTSHKSTETEIKTAGDVFIDPRNDIAWMFYSSGTTGRPKGVIRTHYNIIAEIYQQSHPSIALCRSPGKEVFIAVLPFFHGYGCGLFLHQCLANGDTVIVYPRYIAAHFIESIQIYKATVLVVVPPIAVDMMRAAAAGDRAAFASVHTVLCGAAVLSADMERRLKYNTGIQRVQQVHGMTETGTAFVPEWDDDLSVGSVGIPLCNTECKIVNPQTGEELGSHKNGELLIRGPSVMKGYFNVSSESDIDADRWIHTGDMAHYDDYGRFYIVDRYKQLIKYKGFQVIPSYLENLLLTHPAVADAGVIGLPDERAGELPAAFVVLKAGMMATEADIKTFVDEKVAPYNKLRGGVTFIEKVPRSPSGKILRRPLRDEALRKLNSRSKL
ncbi:4-coumarate--CoA ligase-like 5 [Lamellibrachia satsuma]|nr:4-coumarate--CoA ligase-like 5 [Lamellibrachia satsuma]